MKKEKFEPVELYVDHQAIKSENEHLEKFLDAINTFSKKLKEHGIDLDQELFEEFTNEGHPAIYRKLVEKATKDVGGTIAKHILPQIQSSSSRIAAQYQENFRVITGLIIGQRNGLQNVAIVGGSAIPRGGVLDEIKKSHTVVIRDPKDLEFYQKVTALAEQVNDLSAWLTENYPEAMSLKEALNIAIVENSFIRDANMKRMVRSDIYLIQSDDEKLAVNPVYFK